MREDVKEVLMRRVDAAFTPDKPYVFISYSHNDLDAVSPFVFALLDRGVNIWMDVLLDQGANDWFEEALGFLRSDQCVRTLFFRSCNSLISKNIKDELRSSHHPITVIDVVEHKIIADFYNEIAIKWPDMRDIREIVSKDANALLLSDYSGAFSFTRLCFTLEKEHVLSPKVQAAAAPPPCHEAAPFPAEPAAPVYKAPVESLPEIPLSRYAGTLRPETTLAQFRMLACDVDFCRVLGRLRRSGELFPRQRGIFDYAMLSVLGGCNAMAHPYQQNYYDQAVANPDHKIEGVKRTADWTWSSNARKVVGLEKSGRLDDVFNAPFEVIAETVTLAEMRAAFLLDGSAEYHTRDNAAVARVFDVLLEKLG